MIKIVAVDGLVTSYGSFDIDIARPGATMKQKIEIQESQDQQACRRCELDGSLESPGSAIQEYSASVPAVPIAWPNRGRLATRQRILQAPLP